jgi:phosphoribosyl 1,2-cyclic phosphate phosphodiesterase
MIGCDCGVCRSSDPRDKRTRSSIYVQSAEHAFVVDTGPDFRTQCLRERVRAVDAVVYTHSHTDHIMGFDDLRAFCPPNGGTLPIYAGEETMRDLERVFHFAFNGLNYFPGYVRPEPRIVDGPFQLGELVLTPLPVLHGRAKVFGYLFTRGEERLAAYLSDCKMVPEPVIEKITGVRHLILDALRHKLHPTHMNVTEALEVIAKTGPRQAWFTHLCHDLGHEQTEATLPEGIRIAFDGLKIVV